MGEAGYDGVQDQDELGDKDELETWTDELETWTDELETWTNFAPSGL
jgi:hypothetical protein